MMFTGPPCPRRGCVCTHTDGCDRGWVDLPPRVRNGQTYDRVAPCAICRPVAFRRLEESAARDSRNAR